MRSGTLDVAATAGFAAALEVAARNRVEEEQRLRQLHRELIGSVLAAVPWAVPYGSADDADRLPGIASIGFPGCSADAILMLLDSASQNGAVGSTAMHVIDRLALRLTPPFRIVFVPLLLADQGRVTDRAVASALQHAGLTEILQRARGCHELPPRIT